MTIPENMPAKYVRLLGLDTQDSAHSSLSSPGKLPESVSMGVSSQAISKKLRFEVFKRDRFTCQYCGKKAPDVVLHVDHIHPISKGGTSDLLNLTTACSGCNLGKSNRLLSDSSALERQRDEMEALAERREQLELLLRWRDELKKTDEATVDAISFRIGTSTGLEPNENGRQFIRRWLKKFPLSDLLKAIDDSFEIHMRWKANDEPSVEAWRKAFDRIPRQVAWNQSCLNEPYLPQLAYVQGMLRNKFDAGSKHIAYLDLLRRLHLDGGHDFTTLKQAVRQADDLDGFLNILEGNLLPSVTDAVSQGGVH